MEKKFQPVLLGSDMNVYGVARAFYEQYRIKSTAFATLHLEATRDSRIVDVITVENFGKKEIFLQTLIDYAQSNKDKELILIACGDTYVEAVIQNKAELSKYYHVPYVDQELMERIILKENFYKICDQYGFLYPKTTVVNKENYKTTGLPFSFPVIIKPSNSVLYWKTEFKGKRKVFRAKDQNEYDIILDRIYNSSYDDELIIQDFIPGDDSYMRVLNCYVDRNSKVKLQALGHVLLEEHSPQGIGSHAAIINDYNREILDKVKSFLEDIKYVGVANFDIKYDSRDNTYKFFEINLRQGRSSYYVTAGGSNLAYYFVEDYIYNRELDFVNRQNETLWTVIPRNLIYKYVKNEDLRNKVRRLIKEKKYCNSLIFKEDSGFKRMFTQYKYLFKYYSKYSRYYDKKGV